MSGSNDSLFRHPVLVMLSIVLSLPWGEALMAQTQASIPRGLERNADGTWRPAGGYSWTRQNDPSSLAVQLEAPALRAAEQLADRGDLDAQFRMGQAWEQGQGVPKNDPAAYMRRVVELCYGEAVEIVCREDSCTASHANSERPMFRWNFLRSPEQTSTHFTVFKTQLTATDTKWLGSR